MLKSDKTPFAGLMAGVCANYGKDVTSEMLSVFWNALQDHSYDLIAKAFNEHVKTSRFMPTVADVLEFINAQDPAMQRPGADEAWLRTPPEDLSYWATEEMLGAWSVVAEEMHSDRPDKTAARMAFKDAYHRLVQSAIAQGRPVHWRLVRGTRKDNLEDVIREGLRLGYLPAEEGDALLRLECNRTASLTPLLQGAVASQNAAALEAIATLKAMLTPEPVSYNLDAVRAECEARDRERAQQGRDAA